MLDDRTSTKIMPNTRILVLNYHRFGALRVQSTVVSSLHFFEFVCSNVKCFQISIYNERWPGFFMPGIERNLRAVSWHFNRKWFLIYA